MGDRVHLCYLSAPEMRVTIIPGCLWSRLIALTVANNVSKWFVLENTSVVMMSYLLYLAVNLLPGIARCRYMHIQLYFLQMSEGDEMWKLRMLERMEWLVIMVYTEIRSLLL